MSELIPQCIGDIRSDPPFGAAWKGARLDGKRSAIIRCPNGHCAHLDHEISVNGVVTPSIVCPHEGCTWHVMATLEGWSPW